MISLESIVAAVAVHLNANLTVGTTVQWQGTQIDTGAIDDWLEVWVMGFERIRQRKISDDQRNGTILIHGFAKLTINRYRILELAEDVKDVLKHAEISLVDYDQSDTPEIGRLRVYEPRIPIHSRDFNEPHRTDVRVTSLEFPAYAQEN